MHHSNKDNNYESVNECYKFKEYLWLVTTSENFKWPKIFDLTYARKFDRGFPRFDSNPKTLHDITNNRLKSWRDFLKYQLKKRKQNLTNFVQPR